MWKNILALAALVLSVGISAHLIGSANATMGPMVSIGSNPIQNFGGSVPGDGVITTAPSGQDLIVTGIVTNASNCNIRVGGTTVVPENSYFAPTWLYTRGGYAMPPSMFTTGTATLRVPSGQTLSIDDCGSTSYYVQGYLTQP